MSVSSNGSCLSINYEGKDMTVEELLDTTINAIQKHLNDVQMQLRQCAQSDDRNDTYEEVTEFTDAIEDDVDSMIELFSDLKQVASQIRGKPPDNESKKWYEEHKQKRKEQKQKEKLEKKANKSKIKVNKLDTLNE
jgi:hypothetical protein